MRAVVLVTVAGVACGGAHSGETEGAVQAAPVSPVASAPVATVVEPEAGGTLAWAPTEVQAEMIRRLSARDEGAPCGEVEAGSTDPVEDFVAIVEHVEKPPWVGMRAAACVAGQHAVDAQEIMKDWVAGEQTKGLAIALVGLLDAMPPDVALAVATAAAEGPHATDVAKRADTVKNDEVRAALAAGAPAAE